MATKRILVMSGGGSRGAFQAGAVHHLLKRGLRFDAYLGVSVGSLNAALLGGHPDPGGLGESERRWLWDMWRTSDPGVEGHYDRVFKPFRSSFIDALQHKAELGQTGWLLRLGAGAALAAPLLVSKLASDLPRLLAHTRLERAEPRFPGLGENEEGGFDPAHFVRGLAAAFQPGGMLANGLPVFQSLDRLEEHYLRDPNFLPPLRDLWARDAPIWMSFVCLFDGRYITATTHRSMKPYASQLPGVFFLDPSAGWTDQDLRDCLLASAAIPVRMTLREVRVPDVLDPSQTRPPGARYMLTQVPGERYRACADGGLRSILPLAEALRLADAMVGEAAHRGEEIDDVEIYCVTNASLDRTPPLTESSSALRRLTRYLDCMQEEILANDFTDFEIYLRAREVAAQSPADFQMDLSGSQSVRQEAYLGEIGSRKDTIDRVFRGSQLTEQAPLRLLERQVEPRLVTIEPSFRDPWPGTRDQTIDDLFADLLSFEPKVLRARWDHGVQRASDALG